MKNTLFIFAGEKSGDLHAASLLKELLKILPDCQAIGVGGPALRSLGMHMNPLKTEDFQVMGFMDVLKKAPSLIKNFFLVRKTILKENPKVVLLVDYAEFNMRMAVSLRKAGFKGKIVQFISPTVWAWRKARTKTLAKSLNQLLCILPFEPKFFEKTKLPSIYIGHPLIQKLKEHLYADLENIPKEKQLFALFPGSRKAVIEKNLPFQLRALKNQEATIAISISEEKMRPLIEDIVKKEGLNPLYIPADRRYDLMARADFAIASSGTVTLELALHKVPTIVTYAIKKLDLFIAKDILRINHPFYCIVNILLGKELFPEFIGPNLSFENLKRAVKEFLENPEALKSASEGCLELKKILGEEKASKKGADYISMLLQN